MRRLFTSLALLLSALSWADAARANVPAPSNQFTCQVFDTTTVSANGPSGKLIGAGKISILDDSSSLTVVDPTGKIKVMAWSLLGAIELSVSSGQTTFLDTPLWCPPRDSMDAITGKRFWLPAFRLYVWCGGCAT